MDLKIFDVGSNSPLAQKISDYLNYPLARLEMKTFPDGESRPKLIDNVRGRNCFLIQSTNQPDTNLVRLLLVTDAVHRAHGYPIPVIPYAGYSRQERKDEPRVPISARAVANLLEAAGAREILLMDLHVQAILGFYQDAVPDEIHTRPVLIERLSEVFENEIKEDKIVIASPDAGGAGRARKYAKQLGGGDEGRIPIAMIDKRREESSGRPKVMNVVGDVRNKIVICVDDIIDTALTLANAAGALLDNGATDVFAVGAHGVLSNDAVRVIEESLIKRVYISDSIDNSKKLYASGKFEVVSGYKIIADAIRAIHTHESVSSLSR